MIYVVMGPWSMSSTQWYPSNNGQTDGQPGNIMPRRSTTARDIQMLQWHWAHNTKNRNKLHQNRKQLNKDDRHVTAFNMWSHTSDQSLKPKSNFRMRHFHGVMICWLSVYQGYCTSCGELQTVTLPSGVHKYIGRLYADDIKICPLAPNRIKVTGMRG